MMKKLKPLVVIIIIVSTISCKDQVNKSELTTVQARLDSLTLEKSQEQANKKLVADMYQELFGDKNVASVDKYIDEQYIQHNPYLPDGRAALKSAATGWFNGAPKEKIDIHHLAAEGDLVFIHTRSVIGGQVSSIIDIFRVKDNKIVEHWDVIQAVPEKSANAHPMF